VKTFKLILQEENKLTIL